MRQRDKQTKIVTATAMWQTDKQAYSQSNETDSKQKKVYTMMCDYPLNWLFHLTNIQSDKKIKTEIWRINNCVVRFIDRVWLKPPLKTSSRTTLRFYINWLFKRHSLPHHHFTLVYLFGIKNLIESLVSHSSLAKMSCLSDLSEISCSLNRTDLSYCVQSRSVFLDSCY